MAEALDIFRWTFGRTPTFRPLTRDEDLALKKCESAIEAMPLCAMIGEGSIARGAGLQLLCITSKEFKFSGRRTMPLGFYSDFVLWPQADVMDYRLDFLVLDRRRPDHLRWYDIECDGYDYHSEKSQINRDRARDRNMLWLGILPIRFTGTEIMADPVGCAVQAAEIIKERLGE